MFFSHDNAIRLQRLANLDAEGKLPESLIEEYENLMSAWEACEESKPAPDTGLLMPAERERSDAAW